MPKSRVPDPAPAGVGGCGGVRGCAVVTAGRATLVAVDRPLDVVDDRGASSPPQPAVRASRTAVSAIAPRRARRCVSASVAITPRYRGAAQQDVGGLACAA